MMAALYIVFYLLVAASCILEDFGRARDIRGMTRTQSVIRPAAAICGLATFVTTKILAGLTAHALGTAIGINGIVISISPNLPLLLLGYIFSIIAVVYVQSCWVGRWLVPSDPDD